ncbi:aminodeoxychorismate/anthranilate synthase component II [Pseudoalteromonas shioyasakiensis]|uniref:aminodeoxychorismate/anthranilate synthase component II n=1 Tax=Pseudoalteromonas shioyasakiensis TaxID=1190813 RepID=UPI002117C5FF|nr:aminodeoxychorismate/anthranilate synthase component II [Pseudoalteromonas shioyasakiensis]MCQ8876998.1 aminodeoxychorismate/anthranilate synthase component II [Pseudoalteromonas shioyasakiensis]
MSLNNNSLTDIKIYFLDNFDSFSYNLVDELSMLGSDLVVYRNNIDAQLIFNKMCDETKPVILVLSPGPGTPSDAGCLMALIELCKGKFPMLGICLGQQALTQSYGGIIGHAGETVHGKSSIIELGEHPVFNGMGQSMPVARYHSLMATKVPDSVNVIARFGAIPMAIYQQQDNALGYQFHPESILTPNGAALLQQSMQFLANAKQ